MSARARCLLLRLTPRTALTLGALASVLGLAFTLTLQYAFDVPPCTWCVIQRALLAGIGLVCLLGLVLGRWPCLRRAALGGAALVALLATGSALYQEFQPRAFKEACAISSPAKDALEASGLDTFAPWLFAPRVSCAEDTAGFGGISLALWAALFFADLAAGLALAWWAVPRRRHLLLAARHDAR